MSNFDFLNTKKEFTAFAETAVNAENSLSLSPSACALNCREAAELAVKWLYENDSNLMLPYKDNLSALIYNQSFVETVADDARRSLNYITRLGNLAEHKSKEITYREAVISLSHLFAFIQYIDCRHGSDYKERKFVESLLPGAVATSGIKTKDATEAETRRCLIDIDLKAMGWTFGVDCKTEVEVFGLTTTQSGAGFADYVLFGDDGKPLAVVEAKRSVKGAEAGKEQAVGYADRLEAQHGRRPLIFCTNGYDTVYWDDLYYPERPVYSVFSKDDLVRIVNRRTQRLDLSDIKINKDITDRCYQKAAVHAACSVFNACKRKALLVMATGTGKTRTAASIVDVLSNRNWITNILFLADRRELVKQGKDAFVKHLPWMSVCNLSTRDRNEMPAARAVFSTYPTMMNAINDEKTESGERLFTPAHFDIIIVDEAHRSIFRKYRAIFKYFDALVIGLTATPKTDVDKNTYDFFDLQMDMPTYAYEYDKGVKEGHLCDYYRIEKLYKLPTQGLERKELEPEQLALFEDAFDEDEEIPDYVTSDEINRIYMNIDTNRRVLTELMEKGLKIEGGDKLGKTIIFARNHEHAVFLKQQFDILYPHYRGKFARVIDSKAEDKYADIAKLLEDFKKPDADPQIAISVDMLDTGIDVPEILNLVFFKQVWSKTKFWQMFGRGTRLCKDLLGAGRDKECFYIFDYMGNFMYFDEEKNGREAQPAASLAEFTFKLKARMIHALQDAEHDQEEKIAFRKSLIDGLAAQISSLNRERFEVRAELRYVEKYSNAEAFQYISITETETMIQHLASLVSASGDDESARRFDIFVYRYMLAFLESNEAEKRFAADKVKRMAAALEGKFSLPDVKAQKDLIQKAQRDEFWQSGDIAAWEDMRVKLREIMYCLKKEFKKKIIDITDEVIFDREGARVPKDNTFESYYERARRYIDGNMDKSSIRKLKNNEPLDDEEWTELERIFWSELGSKEEYEREINNVALGRFIRTVTGLSKEAVDRAFSEFLGNRLYSPEQITLVEQIIDYLIHNGTLARKDMLDEEMFGRRSVFEVFNGKKEELKRILDVVDVFNHNAERMAA